MFKHPVVYIDFNNKPHNEDLYFHMMVPEFADLEFNPTFEGSLSDYVREAMRSGEGQKIYTIFKLLVVNSYGRRSEDGSRFTKKAEWTEEFLNSPAWEQFFLWLTDKEDGSNAQLFWDGIFPEALRDRAEKVLEQEKAAPKKSIAEMSREEILELLEKQQGAGGKVIEGASA